MAGCPAISLRRVIRLAGALLAACTAISALAAPRAFDLPAQPLGQALVTFSQQAGIDVLFSADEVRGTTAPALQGSQEPLEALARLLKGTGFAARRNPQGKYYIVRETPLTGGIGGRVVGPDGTAVAGINVIVDGTRLRTTTDAHGNFAFAGVRPGSYRIVASGRGHRSAERTAVVVAAGQATKLDAITVEAVRDVTELDPYLVQDRDDRLPIGEGVGAPPRRAAGNLDLPRTVDNALPFTIFTREQIERSGVVQLNDFFQRELLEGTPSAPPEQNGLGDSFVSGSSNLSLRGYSADETVVLVNGRRLPETITSTEGVLGAPDVNLIPLGLVQQVQVLPASASALYSGNAVGGVINIVLQPEADGTELRTTYTNALGEFDAPQSSVSLQHGRTLLGGKLRLGLNATLTQTVPVAESELGYQQARLARTEGGLLPRDTPNVESADFSPLFGPGSKFFTSVAPGADGTGGLGAFAGRAGVRANGLFDTPGGRAASINSRDFPYGRWQRRAAYYGSVVYDVRPWLQLGLDATYSRTTVRRGYEVFPGRLTLAAGSPLNPFGQDVVVALNDYAPQLGENYNEARLDASSLVAGLVAKLPRDWQFSADLQATRSVAYYRGVIGADPTRWQQLVDAGRYQPLRDTQQFAPPPEFYERVLVYQGGPGRFIKRGDYDTLEATARLTHEALPLPTGTGVVNVGADYRRNHLAPYTDEPRFADGTPAAEIVRWSGRTLERISVFGELQAPLLPRAWLPRGIKNIEADLAVRYIHSAKSSETSYAPTVGFKLQFENGLALRGSYTTSNRYPTAVMSRRLASGAGGGSGADTTLIFDPLRNEQYEVQAKSFTDPGIRPEAAATQTAGLIYQRGTQNRFRVSVDFADTTKTNEFASLDAKAVASLEAVFPDRVDRSTPVPSGPPRITSVITGIVNVARRHSQNWNTTLEYARRDLAGGTLELRGRWTWFQTYDLQLYPGAPVVDELDAPDNTAPPILRHRLTLSSGWFKPAYGFGVDAHYLGPRNVPAIERGIQGGDRVPEYWQVDAYVQADLTRFVPFAGRRFGLNAQLRVNNLSDFGFPHYANDPTGAGVQPYGDWRGRTYSLSLTARW